MIQKCAGVAGLRAMNAPCYPDTDEGFLHTLASTAARTSPAQPIWESNIDTHFLTSGWRGAWQWPDFLMNHYCASAVTYGWYLPAAGCGGARCSDSRLHFQVAG